VPQNGKQSAGGMEAYPQSRQHQFLIRHKMYDGRVLEGQFTTRKLSIKDHAQVNVRRVQLNGGYHHDESNPGRGIDAETDWTNRMIAHLEACLIQKPLWFDVEDIDDAELLFKVFEKCAEFENSFHSPQRDAAIGSQPIGSSQADSGGTGEETRAAGRVEAVGRGQVPASLDP